MYDNNQATSGKSISLLLLEEAYQKAHKNAQKCHNGMCFPAFCPSADTPVTATAGAHERLEEALTHHLRVAHVHKAASHADAVRLSLLTLSSPILGERSLRQGDEIITVGLDATDIAAIKDFGAVPVLADVTLPHYNIDTKELERALSPGTRAVMLTHTLGYPFDLKTVRNFCNDYELWLIEDSASALGAAFDFDGTRYEAGTIGDLGVGSLSPLSPDGMGCGLLYTRDDALSAIAQELLTSTPAFAPTCAQADSDAARLTALPQAGDARRKAAALLTEALQPVADRLVLPVALPSTHPAPMALPLTCGESIDAGALMEALRQRGIPCHPLLSAEDAELLAALCASGTCRLVGELSVTRRILADTLLIPLPLGIAEETLTSVAKAVREALL